MQAPFRADHVGSLLRPPELHELREKVRRGQAGAAELLPELENRDDLKRRIEAAAKFVPLENLCLSPQCGFSSTHHGNNLTVEQEKAKLRLCIEVAREVWG